MRCAAGSHYDTYHVFEPRPGQLAAEVLVAAGRRIPAQGGADRYRVVDGDDRVVATGTRDECIDVVERAWWRVEAATLAADQVAAASRAVRLTFERWEPTQGFVPDRLLTGIELERHRWA